VNSRGEASINLVVRMSVQKDKKERTYDELLELMKRPKRSFWRDFFLDPGSGFTPYPGLAIIALLLSVIILVSSALME
jgi:hypothetical protein